MLIQIINKQDFELCECSKIVVLVIQIMYEMGKATLATQFAYKFYRDVKCVPYDIIFVWYVNPLL